MQLLETLRAHLRKLTYSALCLALCMVLPFLTGQIREIGNMLCPMHLPVFLTGFLCGPWYGLAVGAIAPLLRFFLFGRPIFFPSGLAMCFELAAYGLISGLLYRRLPRKNASLYISLVSAMLLGRAVWGAVMVCIAGLSEVTFSWAAFMTQAFLNAIPGIVIQLLLIPVLVLAVQRAAKSRT